MTNYKTFTKLLTNASIEDALPDIDFTDNTIQLLRTSIEHLSTSYNDSETFLNTAKNISTAIKEYQTLSENMVDHYNDLKPIRDVSDAFAKALHAGIKSLSNVKKSVSSIKEEVDSLSNKMMVGDPVVAASMSHIEDTSIKFSKINWEDLNDLDPVAIYNNMNLSIAVEPNKAPNKTQISILINRLPFASDHNSVEFKKIDINKQAARDTLEQVSRSLGSRMDIKDIKYVLGMLFDLDNIKCLNAVRTFREVLDKPSIINSVIQLARDFSLVLGVVNSNTLKFSNTTNQELLARADVLQQYAEMALYISAYYRHVAWKDAIVVPGNRLNPDNWYDFRSKGGSTVGLQQHLNYYYDDMALPAMGVSVSEVLEQKDALHKAAQEEMSDNMEEVQRKKKDIVRNAFILTATKWVNANKKFWTLDFDHNNNVSGYVASVYDSTVEASVESSLYRVILNSCCSNPLVRRLYNELSDIYTKHATVGGELTEQQTNALDMTVYAKLVTQFLFQQKIIE